MIQIAEMYSSPGGLRDLLGQYTELSNYPQYFTEVAEALKAAQALVVEAATERREAYKGTKTSVEAKLERVLRQIFFVLEAAQQVEDGAMVAGAEKLTQLILPEGRQSVNYSVTRKVGDAQLADDRVGPEERKLMKQIKGPGGTLADLHEQRMEYAAVLHGVEIKLLELGLDLELEANTLAEARRKWMRTVVMLESQINFLELSDNDRHKLWSSIERASERGEKRRGARASGEAAVVNAVVEGAVTGSAVEQNVASVVPNPGGAGDVDPAGATVPGASVSSTAGDATTNGASGGATPAS